MKVWFVAHDTLIVEDCCGSEYDVMIVGHFGIEFSHYISL